MTLQRSAYEKTLSLALEASIYIGLMLMLAIACLSVLRPFIPLLTGGILIAVAVYPEFLRLQKVLKGSETLAAVLCTLILLMVLILPVVLVAHGLFQGIQGVTTHLKQGTAVVPPPPTSIESWPIIGAQLKRVWALASEDLSRVAKFFAPRIKSILPDLLSTSANVALTVLQLLLSVLVAGFLLANSRAAHEMTCSLSNRLFGDRGSEFQRLVGATIRSVSLGILGVAAIQAAFAALGFWVAGLPAVSIWIVLFVFAAVLQAGVLVLIPAVIYVYAVASITKAVIFMVWCMVVGLMDNVLKPLLLGRGVGVPVAVVFFGAIGGFVATGIIGLFVGAIILSVGYKLFLGWLDNPPSSVSQT